MPPAQPALPLQHLSIVLIEADGSIGGDLAGRLRTLPEFRILAATADVETALRHVRDSRPDLVLLNLPWEESDGMALAGALHGEAPASRVILMGIDRRHRDVAGFVRAGVSGFIMAGAPFEDYLQTIRAVAAGVQVLPAELTRALFHELIHHGRVRLKRTMQQLTGRERQVAQLITEGLSNREIGIRLQIAIHTVKHHVHNVLSKLALSTRLEVAAFSEPGESPPLARAQSRLAPV